MLENYLPNKAFCQSSLNWHTNCSQLSFILVWVQVTSRRNKQKIAHVMFSSVTRWLITSRDKWSENATAVYLCGIDDANKFCFKICCCQLPPNANTHLITWHDNKVSNFNETQYPSNLCHLRRTLKMLESICFFFARFVFPFASTGRRSIGSGLIIIGRNFNLNRIAFFNLRQK